MKQKKRQKQQRESSVGCLFWTALILLIMVIFLFNRTRIVGVLEATGFTQFITGLEKKEPEVVRVPGENPVPAPSREKSQDPAEAVPDRIVDTMIPEITMVLPEDKPEAMQSSEQQAESAEPKQEPLQPQQVRRSVLYFVKINDDGSIELKQVIRPIYFDSSPLTRTLEALIGGLTPSELNQGLLTLIPENTVIYGIRVSDGIAYIDFSESLRFNPFGVEGLEAELKQIVFTATEFPTVNKVQFLIEGKKLNYLAMEGIFIGEPLSRSSFNRGS